MDEFDFYNRHYIAIDDLSRIVDGWSDGPLPDKSTEGAVLINEHGGYQFRLIIDGVQTEENPVLYEMRGIPLYKYEGGEIVRRTQDEIDADYISPAPVIDDRDVALAELASMTADNMLAIAEIAAMIGGDA